MSADDMAESAEVVDDLVRYFVGSVFTWHGLYYETNARG